MFIGLFVSLFVYSSILSICLFMYPSMHLVYPSIHRMQACTYVSVYLRKLICRTLPDTPLLDQLFCAMLPVKIQGLIKLVQLHSGNKD